MRISAPAVRRLMRAMAASPRALSRPTSTSRAPIAASCSAATSPMPDVAPVMTQTLPCISCLCRLLGLVAQPSKFLQSALAVEDVEAAGDDHRRADPSPQVRPLVEGDVADDHRADELAVVERRDHRR